MKKFVKYLSSFLFFLVSFIFIAKASLADMLPPGNFESIPKELRKGFFEIVTPKYVLIGTLVVFVTIYSFSLMARIRNGEKLFGNNKNKKVEGDDSNVFFPKESLRKFKVFALMLIAGATAGSIPTASKIAMGSDLVALTPLSVLFFRYFIAFFCMLLVIIERKELSLNHFKHNFIPSFFAILNPIALFYALSLGSKASVSILIYAIGPTLTALYFVLFKNRKLSNSQFFGILIGFIGVLMIVGQPVFQEGQTGSLEGNMLSFLATVFFVTYNITSSKKQGVKEVSPYSLIFYSSIIAMVISFMPMLNNVQKVNFEMNQILALVWLGTVSTVIFFTIFQYIVRRDGALVASVYAYLQATLGAIIGVVVLGEKMTTLVFVGAILTFIGTKVSTSAKKVVEEKKVVKRKARTKKVVSKAKKKIAKKVVIAKTEDNAKSEK